jgi:hypothetical protein
LNIRIIKTGINIVAVKNLSWLKPAVNKRTLLFLAACVWTFAGSMLMFKGYKMLDLDSDLLWLKLVVVLAAGVVFYLKVFSRLSMKHTLRILNMKVSYPCMFSFFNFRSYLIMLFMITMGIAFRTAGWIPFGTLSFLYLMMSVPLMLSSVRFYYTGIYFRKYVV